jgi:hypothetical protein
MRYTSFRMFWIKKCSNADFWFSMVQKLTVLSVKMVDCFDFFGILFKINVFYGK